ncbi:MAG: M23 family metallopeptidase [candidate division WOR-3 bacterium]
MSKLNIILFEKKINRIVSFTIRKYVLYLIVGLIFLLIPFSLYLMIVNSQQILFKNRYQRLIQENTNLKNELFVVKSQVDTLSKQLRELAELDAQIRLAANLELLPKDLQAMGYGGSKNSELIASVDNLIERARLQEKSFRELNRFFEQQKVLLEHTPSIWPVSGYISSGFGYRKSPFSNKTDFHDGIDIVAPLGTPIRSPAAGRVVYAGYKAGWGNYVEIDHGYGYITVYGHCQQIKVFKGQRVNRGDTIATVGRTGSATGNHLHYGIKVAGNWVNPLNYILTDYATQ